MKRFKEYSQNQRMLLPPSLEELIGPKDLVRVVNEVVDSIDTEAVKERFSKGGCRPAYHPEMMLKVLVYSYSMKMYSVRQIARALQRDVTFMWLSGMQKPDFRTLNRFRGEYFKGLLEKIFAEVVLILLERGYVKGEDYFVDGTKLAANAGKNTYIWSKNVERYKGKVTDRIKEILAEVDKLNESEDEEFGGKDLPEYEGDGKLSKEDIEKAAKAINERLKETKDKDKKSKLTKADKEVSKLKERIEKYEEHERILDGRNSYSKTDKEASFLRMKNDELRAGYNLQVGTENGFVVGFSVHQNASDGPTFRKHLEKRKEQGLKQPKRIVTDAAYGTEENYQELADRKIESFLKYPRYLDDVNGTRKPFDKENFSYDLEKDLFICPAGKKLEYHHTENSESSTGFVSHLKIYKASRCKGCRFKSQCCKGGENRSIQTNENLAIHRLDARTNLTSEEGVALRKRRGNEVESIFGDMKHNQRFTRFSLRGLSKVSVEAALNLIAFNIRKMAVSMVALQPA